MIDYREVQKVFGTTLLEGEVVELIASGQLIAIRAGVYNAGLHIRPADPGITPVLEPADLSLMEFEFDRGGKDMYVQETFLPAIDQAPANEIEQLGGIMQYSVYVPIKKANGYDADIMQTTGRYIRELFNPELPDLDTGEFYNLGLTLDAAEAAPEIKGDAWVSLPVSLSFRSINITA